MFLVPEAMQSEHVNVLSRIARRLGDRQVAADMRVVAENCLLTG
jgi:mannitol/fructose-specific phosphotransferase system IIA component (Ntr-type)